MLAFCLGIGIEIVIGGGTDGGWVNRWLGWAAVEVVVVVAAAAFQITQVVSNDTVCVL